MSSLRVQGEHVGRGEAVPLAGGGLTRRPAQHLPPMSSLEGCTPTERSLYELGLRHGAAADRKALEDLKRQSSARIEVLERAIRDALGYKALQGTLRKRFARVLGS